MQYRIEAFADTASGLFYVEVFRPGNATTPVAKTKPIYASLEEAKRRVEEALGATFAEPATKLVANVFAFDNV